jgi:hypothetical protein
MNPNKLYAGDRPEAGMIDKQKEWQDKVQKELQDKNGKGKGMVIIAFDRPCIYTHEKPKPTLGFFYNTSIKSLNKVTHRFSIIDIADDEQICNYLKNEKSDIWKEFYLPPWRRELFEDACKSVKELLSKGLAPNKKETWMLITDICELKQPQPLAYFGKKRCQSFVYNSKGSELECV